MVGGEVVESGKCFAFELGAQNMPEQPHGPRVSVDGAKFGDPRRPLTTVRPFDQVDEHANERVRVPKLGLIWPPRFWPRERRPHGEIVGLIHVAHVASVVGQLATKCMDKSWINRGQIWPDLAPCALNRDSPRAQKNPAMCGVLCLKAHTGFEPVPPP